MTTSYIQMGLKFLVSQHSGKHLRLRADLLSRHINNGGQGNAKSALEQPTENRPAATRGCMK